MEILFRVTLGLTGIINLLPAMLAFMPGNITKSYGTTLPDGNYELLLRHRAVLFGVVGGLMVYSALSRRYFELATIVGLLSMVSFVVLFFIIDKPINAQLKRVMQIDVVASLVLLMGLVIYWLASKKTT